MIECKEVSCGIFLIKCRLQRNTEKSAAITDAASVSPLSSAQPHPHTDRVRILGNYDRSGFVILVMR